MTRKRMTAQSVVNVKAAVKAHLIPTEEGYLVELEGSTGKRVKIKDGDGDLMYSSMANANKSIAAHNPALNANLEPEI